MPTVQQIAASIENVAPLCWAEEWDNCGLLVGELTAQVQRVFLCLDTDRETLSAASARNCQLIISHHPPLFYPLKKIVADNPQARLIVSAIKAGLNLYAAHTNFDKAPCGHAAYLARLLELQGIRPLGAEEAGAYCKLVVFVPASHLEALFQGLVNCGAGSIGSYDSCSFRLSGQGTFRPLAGAQPYLGTTGKLEQVEEVRLELILPQQRLSQALLSIEKTHPYETPAYDLYPLLNREPGVGLGRIGTLAEPQPIAKVISRLKDRLKLAEVRCSTAVDREVSKIALVPGSGASLIKEAASQQASVLISGDLKYHDYQLAADLGLALVDIGHFGSEFSFVDCMALVLEESWGEGLELIKQSGESGQPYEQV